MNIANPRIKTQNTWYSYYAGFSTDFVDSVIRKYGINERDLILDPWNGSGTTTTVAYRNGIDAVGIDINPATIAIAKSRLLSDLTFEQVMEQFNILESTVKSSDNSEIDENDMLLLWLNPESAQIIRNIERTICDTFGIENGLHLDDFDNHNSELASFFYVALFCTVKHYLAESKSKNPTWMKTIKIENLNREDVFNVLKAYLLKNLRAIPRTKLAPLRQPEIQIKRGNSTEILLGDRVADYIITSPPYCTRIDYAVTTKVELAVLGYSQSNFRELRDMMIGTTTIHCNECSLNSFWGKEALAILSSIQNHRSYASSGYYFKTYWQYFYRIYKSLFELNRVLKSNGHAIIVVQDSFYKEIHVDLAKIYIEMASTFGWECEDHLNFKKQQSLSSINSKSHPNGKSSKRIETVIVFRKRG